MLEVETDKAVFPVEANASGVIHLGPFKKGDVVPVITTVALIGKPMTVSRQRLPELPAASRPLLLKQQHHPVVSAQDAAAAADLERDARYSLRRTLSPRRGRASWRARSRSTCTW